MISSIFRITSNSQKRSKRSARQSGPLLFQVWIIDMKDKLKQILIPIFAVTLLTSIDQITKLVARNILEDGPVALIEGVFEFSLVFNTGVAWGMFDNMTVVINILAILIMAFVAFLYFKMPVENKRLRALKILMIFIFAGALGNCIDRFMMSAVTDFLYFELINFPVFNVADCYVTVSGILIAILLIFYYKEEDFKFLKKKKGQSDV